MTTSVLTVENARVVEGDSGSVFLEFPLSLSAQSGVDIRFDVINIGGSAIPDIDYFDFNGFDTVTIPSGDTEGSIFFAINEESVAEGDETIQIELSNLSNATFAGGGLTERALGIIEDDDGENRPALFVENVRVVEGNVGTREAVFDITLTRALGSAAAIPFETVGITATPGQDFVPASGTVNFGANDTEAQVTVTLPTDTTIEASEQFALVLDPSALDLSSGPGGAVGLATILDDDAGAGAQPVLSIADARVVEGDSGTRFLSFILSLSGPASSDISYDVRTLAGTAFPDSDYFDLDGGERRTIPAGVTTDAVFIGISEDSRVEGDETFFVELFDVDGAAFEGGAQSIRATGVIVDEDGENRPALSVGDVRVIEGNAGLQQAVFEINLTRPFDTDVSIPFTTVGVTATPAQDFTPTTGTVDFAAGQTLAAVAVNVAGDTAVEQTERFDLVLDPSGLDLSSGPGSAVGSAHILDDDAGFGVQPVITLEDARVFEGDSGTRFLSYAVLLSTASATDISFDARTVAGTATPDTDYFDLNGGDTFTISAGNTERRVFLSIGEDNVLEGDENLWLELSNAQGAVFEGGERTLSAQGIIEDDDGETRPALFVEDRRIVEGNAGTKEAVFEITLSRPFATAVSIPYTTVGVTATAGEDFVPASGAVSFAPGQTHASVTVDLPGDTDVEATEQFDLVLDPSGLDLSSGPGTAVGTATILDDDAGGGTQPVLTVEDSRVFEGDSGTRFFAFKVSLSAPSPSAVAFDVATIRGTAIPDTDYSDLDGGERVTIPAGDTSRTLFLSLREDSVLEGDEDLAVELSNVAGAVFEGGTQVIRAEGIIEDNDGENRAALFVEDARVVEGDSGTQEVQVKVFLSRPQSEEVAVGFTTAPAGTADNGDVVGSSGTLTFAPGQTEAAVTVEVVGDTASEPTEAVDVVLSGPSGGDFFEGAAGARGTVTILDDDSGGGGQPVLSVADAEVFEGDSGTRFLAFKVSLSGPAPSDITYRAATIEDTATGGSTDFTGEDDTFVIPAGQTTDTVFISIREDNIAEGDEQFFLEVSNPVGASLAGGANELVATGTITDDDVGSPNLSPLTVEDIEIREPFDQNVQAFFTISNTLPAGLNITGDWEIVAGTAVPGQDFAPRSGSFTIPSGQVSTNVAVPIVANGALEGPETVVLKLSNIVNAGAGSQSGEAFAIGTIDDGSAPDFDLELGIADTRPFGQGFDGATDPDGLVTFGFQRVGLDLDLSFSGFDIDTAGEVEVLLNGQEIASLDAGVNNGLADYEIEIEDADLVDGTNLLTFAQRTNAQFAWGVTDVLIDLPEPDFQLVPGVVETGSFGNAFDGATDQDGRVTAGFFGVGRDFTLDVTGFDIDTATEVEVLLNGQSLGFLDPGPNDGLGASSFFVPAEAQNPGENVIGFAQRLNPGFKWGVTDVAIQPNAPDIELALGGLEDGSFGNAFNGATDADGRISIGFQGTDGDLTLAFRGFDIDAGEQVELFLNGESLGVLDPGTNNGLASYLFGIDADDQREGDNTLTFVQSVPGFRWGVTEIALLPTEPDIQLMLGEVETGSFGNAFNGAFDSDGIVTASFQGTADDLELSLTGFDIDTGDEVEVWLNGASLGFLDAGPDNGFADYVFDIPAADQRGGENLIAFVQSLNPGFRWGVTNVLIAEPQAVDVTLTLGDVETGSFGNAFDGATDADGVVTAAFEGGDTDLDLSFSGFDIDNGAEVELWLNGASLGFLDAGVNDGLADYSFRLDADDLEDGTNEISFIQRLNPGFKWGITDILIEEAASAADVVLSLGEVETGSFGNAFNGATDADGVVTASFEGEEGNVDLSFSGFDIDTDEEVEVLLNGESLGFLGAGANDGLTDYGFLLDDADVLDGPNEISFVQRLNPGFKWGVTDILVDITPELDSVLELGEADTASFGNAFNGATDADGIVQAGFEGTGTDLLLTLTGFDIDTGDEVELLLNGDSIGFLDQGVNDGEADYEFQIPAEDQRLGDNVLSFVQSLNPGFKWGVTDLLIVEQAIADGIGDGLDFVDDPLAN